MDPFLDLPAFQLLWDGPPLTPRQRAQVTLWLGVASNWIYRNGPKGELLPKTDSDAQFVVYDVVSNAVRYQKYSKLSTFNRTTAHRIDSGTFGNPMQALDFTDNHKMHLGIPLSSVPMDSFERDDFGTFGLGHEGGYGGFGLPTHYLDREVDYWRHPRGNICGSNGDG